MSNERWVMYPTLDGPYAVSDLGRFRRIAPRKGGPRIKDGFITPFRHHNYMTVGIQHGPGDRRSKLFHLIVMEAFVGPAPKGMQVNHKDGDTANNRLNNLEYVTPKQNVDHAFANGLMEGRECGGYFSSWGYSKLTPENVAEIRNSSVSAYALAKKFGVARVTVSRARRYMTHKNLP